MSTLRFVLFGFPRFEQAGHPLPISRRRALALAAYLAASEEPHSRDFLATLIWPEFDAERGRSNLRRELSILRSEVAPDLIEADGAYLRFGTTPNIDVDVRAFLAATADLAGSGMAGVVDLSSAAIERLSLAADLQQYRFLEGFGLPDSPAFDDWQYLQAEELERRLATVLQILIAWRRAHDQYEAALTAGRRWLDLDRLNEAAHRSLIEDYAHSGQWVAAQRQLERCAALLDEELGLEPEIETLTLARQIRERRLPSGHAPEPAVGITIEAGDFRARDRLPALPGRLVGRESEIAELSTLLRDGGARLVTLVGPGGIGKTRLALGVATSFARQDSEDPTPRQHFSDGIAFVELAALDRSDQVIAALAGTLGVERRSGARQPEELLDDVARALRQRRMLLVLDNFEHLIDAATSIGELAQRAPHVTFLVTSRERLNLHAEHVFRVDGLTFSDALGEGEAAGISPAAELFIQRARMVDHAFALDVDIAAAVASICRMLDGMPLAIELAAARLDLYTTAEVAAEIERGIDILEARSRDVPARQRSMQVVFDASWGQLAIEEQAALVQLSVFRGGFTREAAQFVAGATVPILERLVSRSLIRFDRPRLRFQIHELMRQYLSGKLDSEPELAGAAAQQHSAYYCRWIEQRAPAFKDARQPSALAETRLEYDNIRVAWDLAIDIGSIGRISEATEGLALFLELEGRVLDGRTAMSRAANGFRPLLAGDGPSDALRLAYARTLAWQSAFERVLGNTDAASRAVREILEISDGMSEDRAVRAFALLQTGTGRFTTAATEGAADYIESARLFREAGERWGEGLALAEVGRVMWSAGNLDEAGRWYRQSLEIFRALGNQREIANLLGLLSQIARYQARPDEAVEHATEMLALTRESGSRFALANALGALGGSLYFSGDFEEAARLLARADALYRELGTTTDHAAALMRRGRVAAVLGDLDAAYRWSQESRDIYTGIDLLGSVAYIDTELATIELAQARAGPATGRMERHLAAVRTLERPLELSKVLSTLALIDHHSGNRERATARARESLQSALDSGGRMVLIEAMASVLPIATTFFGPERVASAWSCLRRFPWVRESVLFRTLIGDDARLLEPLEPTSPDLDPEEAARMLLSLFADGSRPPLTIHPKR